MIYRPEITLTRTQSEFLQCDAREAVYRGGLGAGKTHVLGNWGIGRASRGRTIVLTEPTFPMVRDVLIPTLEELLAAYKYPYTLNKSSYTIKLFNGLILMRSGDRPDGLRGINADDAGIDEGSYTKKEVYEQLIARTRKSPDAQIRVAGTPAGRDWVFDLSLDAELFVQSTFANPFLPESYKRHLVKRYTKEMIKQELLGEIIDFSTGILRAQNLNKVFYRTFTPSIKVRSWDLAVTEKNYSDYTAGVLFSTDFENFAIEDICRYKKEWPESRRRIIAQAQKDGHEVPIVVEAVGTQKALVDDLRSSPELRGFSVIGMTPRGSKFNRAITWGAKAELGKVEVVAGRNAERFFRECDEFTVDDSHKHDDIIDAVSGAYIYCLDNPLGSSGKTQGLYA